MNNISDKKQPVAGFKNMPVCAVDALGRRMPEPGISSTERENSTVGLFYFLWLCCHNKKLYNISEITDADPEAGYKTDDPKWGGIGDMHYWGEPFYGYYSMDDEWVIRRHMKLIMQAEIDFLFFDTTNAVIYEPVCHRVMKVLQEYARQGFKIPKVMFYTNTRSGWTVQKIYEEFYKPGLYRETWFEIDGKPVIIAIPGECSDEVREFFNIKLSQWPNEPTKQGGWPWMDFEKPQRIFENLQGEPESINVSVAQHPQIRFGDSVMYGETTNCGRAWHDGDNDKGQNAWIKGLNLAEQFERALETHPPIVLVTGWNEWIAGRWQGPPERPIMFVDCANYEFSRDIEMMRDGYFDNYFMQLISYVRQYKGTRGVAPAACGEKTVYEGFTDGAFKRDCLGWTDEIRFENFTMRTSIKRVTVSHTEKDLKFEIEASEIPERSGAFFNIFVSVGERAGYDFILNYVPEGAAVKDGEALVARIVRPDPYSVEMRDIPVERPCDRLDNVFVIGENALEIGENTVTVTVPLTVLGLGPDVNPEGKTDEIWFKVADSTEPYKVIDDFYDKGDVLPMGRAGFVYRMDYKQP